MPPSDYTGTAERYAGAAEQLRRCRRVTRRLPPSDTPAPQVGPREIAWVVLQGDPNGAFDVTWSAPSETPFDYRIGWAEEGDEYLSWRDESGNAYPVGNAYTITGLDVNACYKIRVRARYNGSAGGWTEVKGRINGSC